MGKKRRKLIAALVAVVLGGLAWAVLVPHGPPEPVYQGKPVSWWLRNLNKDKGDTVTYFFQATDSNVVPFLEKALETRDGPSQRAYLKLWLKMPLVLRNRLAGPVPAWTVRANAAQLLGDLGDSAKTAIPSLIRAMDDAEPWVRYNAAFALGQIGKDDKRVTDALVKALKDHYQMVHYAAGEALKQIDPEAATKAGVK